LIIGNDAVANWKDKYYVKCEACKTKLDDYLTVERATTLAGCDPDDDDYLIMEENNEPSAAGEETAQEGGGESGTD
jgi:hypothetical protein